MDKRSLSERDLCTKFIAPAISAAGWDIQRQVREEVSFTKGRIIVRGKLHSRGKSRRADFILYHQPNLPPVVIEAKDNAHGADDGVQRTLDYAKVLDMQATPLCSTRRARSPSSWSAWWTPSSMKRSCTRPAAPAACLGGGRASSRLNSGLQSVLTMPTHHAIWKVGQPTLQLKASSVCSEVWMAHAVAA